MSLSLRDSCFEIWGTNLDRKGLNQNFKPIFNRYIGVEDTASYADVLYTLVKKCKEKPEHCLIFDNEVSFDVDFDLIRMVKNELPNTDMNDFPNAGWMIMPDASSDPIDAEKNLMINQMLTESIQYVYNLAKSNNEFPSQKAEFNFLVNIILYSFLHIRPMKFDDNFSNKCIYYGKISRDDMYFLILLHRMTFDVLYIDPAQTDDERKKWILADRDKLSTESKFSQILPTGTLQEKIAHGKEIHYVESATLRMQNMMTDSLFTGTGSYRPWQFKDGYTQAVMIHSTIYDLKNNWREPARLRNGFDVKEKTVYVPHHFMIINGEDRDIDEYISTFELCTQSENTFIVKNDELAQYFKKNDNESCELVFCLLNDYLINTDKVKEMPFYNLKRYQIETQNFILNKLNEVIENRTNIFTKKFSKEEIIQFIYAIVTLDDKVTRYIDNFDFTETIPKISLFIEKDNSISNETLLLLGFFSTIGFDIVIFCPSGLCNISQTINSSLFDTIRLDNMNYERVYESLKKSKKGFLKNLFR